MPESPLFAVPMLEGGSDYPSPDATADAKQVNDQFKYAEQFWGVKPVTSGTLPSSPKNQQFIVETDTGKLRYWNGTTWVNLRDNLRGTTAQRNAYFGTPLAADRAALANTIPLWYNTDKGFEEQYFAQFDDAGVTATTPVKKVFGWKPASKNGRVALSVFSVASSDSPANVKKYGSTVELTGTSSAIVLDNVFTADFDEYEIEFEITGVTAGLSVQFLLRNAGANLTSGVYNSQ